MVSCFSWCCSGVQEWMQVISVCDFLHRPRGFHGEMWICPSSEFPLPFPPVTPSLLLENCSSIAESEQLPRHPIPTFEEPPARLCQDLSGWVVPIYFRYWRHWCSKMIWKSLSLKGNQPPDVALCGGKYFPDLVAGSSYFIHINHSSNLKSWNNSGWKEFMELISFHALISAGLIKSGHWEPCPGVF